MLRVLLDTNVYGEIIIDSNTFLVIKNIKNSNMKIYGLDIIRKELRNTPKKIRVEKRGLRVSLLSLYDNIVKQDYVLNKEILSIAKDYYLAYREIGGIRKEKDILNDLIIIACASLNNLDIVVSNDEKTMFNENAIRAYKLINDVKRLRTPNLIDYNKFKRWLT
ncbi:MAG: PIN domain-containing protein [Nanoarchaeota archaeon]|nr:PIN domain-containing protein [Nanoarchaeota archaeon]